MGKTLKQKIAEWWFRLKSISGVLADGENTYKKWQRTLTGFLIFFIVFEFVGPSAVAWLKVETAMAAVPAASFDVANNAVETFTSQNILNLPKFDDKNQALVNKALSGNQPDFDLVAILVDDDIANNASSYNGLIDEHNPRVPANHPELKLEGDTLMSRVERYAKDVQSSDGAAYVKTLIIKIKKNDSTADLAAALERLYLEGDGTKLQKNHLVGIVLIGDVPLPVVNKNGNKFPSLFPYTDFADPYYIFDGQSGDFIRNPNVEKVQAEVWHGVIKAPAEGEEGNKLLAEYFDKNHLFKAGDPEYRNFAKKIFYSDLQKEFKTMGAEGLPKYFSYLKYWEDISYVRYNKRWLNKLYTESGAANTEGDGVDNDGDGKIDEDPMNGYDDDGDGEPGSPLFGLINQVDDDGDGKIDNDEEGVWGYCHPIPPKGKVKIENCGVPGKPYKTENFYNTLPGSIYKVSDGVNNNPEDDTLIDEKIDEDEGDPLIGIDNDRDGRVDEDTSADNDADHDGKIDEDPPGDINGDGCPGECGVDENLDSIDADNDGWPDGYERDFGSLWVNPVSLGNTIKVIAQAPFKAHPNQFMIDNLKADSSPTDSKGPWNIPWVFITVPLFVIPVPRIFPWPNAEDWVDNSVAADDDEDGKVDEDGLADNDNDQDGFVDEDPGDALGTKNKPAVGVFDQLADIQTKTQIDAFMAQYNNLFEKFFSEINGWVENTGRYSTLYKDGENNATDLFTFPLLISLKDEFTRIYLKAVNDAVEARVDNYVQKLEEDVNLIRGATLSGYVVLPDGNGVDNQHIDLNPVEFINFGYRNDALLAGLEAFFQVWNADPSNPLVSKWISDYIESHKMILNAATPILINGKAIETIKNIEECSLYRGSNGDGEQSQMVIAKTVYDPKANLNTGVSPMMPKEWAGYDQDALIGTEDNDYKGLFWHWNNGPENYLDEGYFSIFPSSKHSQTLFKWMNDQKILNKSFAGCFSDNATKPERCFADLATRYIFSLGGTRPASNVPESAVSHRACFDFKEKTGYDNYNLKASKYLSDIGNKVLPEDKDALDPQRPSPAEAYNPPKNIKLFDMANRPPTQFVLPDGTKLPINPVTLIALKAGPLKDFTINLEDILKQYFRGNRVDDNANGVVDEAVENKADFFMIDPASGQPNWQLVGDTLLAKTRNNEAAAQEKDKPLLFGNGIIPGVKELSLSINTIAGQAISSMVFHKEPTIDTQEAQTYELARDANGNLLEDLTLDDQTRQNVGKYKLALNPKSNKPIKTQTALTIPIDSPRYVSFRDINGNYQKIIYPNVYKVKSIEEYRQQLSDLEAKLATIPVNPVHAAAGPAELSGYLTAILDGPHNYDDPVIYHVLDKDVSSYSRISTVKLVDALAWKEMDLDKKHEYSMRYYWGSSFNPFTTKDPANGYEILYLNSSGNSSAISMKFNKDIPGPKEEPKVDTVDCNLPENKMAKACREPEGDNKQATPVEGAAEVKEPDMTPIFILEWFAAMKKWADETNDILNGKGGSVKSCPAGGFTDIPDDKGYSPDAPAHQEIQLYPAIDANGDGISDATEKTVKLNLKLRDSSKNVLRSGTTDQAVLEVEALDKDGKLNISDNSNQVKLLIKTIEGKEPVVQMLSADQDQLTAGQTKFTVQAGENSGAVSIQAISTTLKGVVSNNVVISSTKANIKLNSYIRYTNYSFVEGPSVGLTVFDGNGRPIAEVDPKTGYLTTTDDKYEVKAFPAAADRPVHLAVVEKSSGQKMAVLYFVMDQTKAINFDDAKVDYMKVYEGLNGVHIKDLNAADQFKLQTVNEEGQLKGDVAIFQAENKFNNGKIGLIDRKGNIFLSNDLQLDYKPGLSSSSPVVFVVKDKNGNPLLEVYNAARFEKIEQLSWDQLKAFFEKILESLPLAMVKKILAREWTGQQSTWKLAILRIAHAAANMPDSDQDGLNDLEELLIGTMPQNPDSNGDQINDLESLNQGIDPVKKGVSLFKDLKSSDSGYADIIKLYRRGLFVADKNGAIRPNDPINREEFIKLDLGGICVICDNFNESIKKSVWSIYSFKPFPDQNISTEYKYCVAEGKNRGIISGYQAYKNAGYYIPNGLMTRAEASKVILETSRQQIASFPEFANENLNNKPWYYNYVLTAQREGIYPKGKLQALDALNPVDFKNYFDSEINKPDSELIGWLSKPISRMEFAIMISRFVDKYDCMQNDQDGDGLPDNLEKYIYATSPIDADTDGGGVKDGAEVLRKSDPNNKDDDFPKPDPNGDPDGDGLTTGQEDKIGSNPFDADTDKGGVTDGNEVLLKIDPLNKEDDNKLGAGTGLENGAGEGKDGAFVSGIEINPKKIYTVPDQTGALDEQMNIEETDRIPADGVSEIYVKATIYGEDEEIANQDNSSMIRFGFKNPDDYKSATLDPINVRVKNGVAETKLISKTKTGLPEIIASVDGKNIPSDQKQIEVYALEPAQIDLKPVSPIIPSGGLSNTNIKLVMVDKNNNLTNNGSYTITLNTTSDLAGENRTGDSAVLNSEQDENPDLPGIQVSSVTGEYLVKLSSGKLPEHTTIKASFTPTVVSAEESSAVANIDSTSALTAGDTGTFKSLEISKEAKVETRDDLAIKLKADQTELKADGKESTYVTVSIVDANGEKIQGFEGEITAKMFNKDLGTLINQKNEAVENLKLKLVDSEAKFMVRSTRKAGQIKLLFNSEGINSANLALSSYAYKPLKIVLDTNSTEVEADPKQIYTINARVYDNDGNLVERDNSTDLSFSIDTETAKFAKLVTNTTVKVNHGKASVSFVPEGMTGPVRIRAKAKDLVDGYLEINLNKYFKGKEFREIKPKILFASMLGSNFGELTQNDYLAGWFVFSGKAESAVSLITDPKPKARMLEILPTGKVKLNDTNNLEARVEPANTKLIPPNLQIVSDVTKKQDVLESFMVLKPQTEIKLLSGSEQIDAKKLAVNVINMVPDDTAYNFNANTDQVNIVKNGIKVAEILRNGNINILSPDVSVSNIAEAEGNLINWSILDNGNEIGQIIFNPGDLGDVKLLDSSFDFGKADIAPGIYVKILANLPNREMVKSYSGNSTMAAKGYYYVDQTQELDKGQAPGFDYLSLESAENADGMGFTGDNKHILLMAAGSSIGEANLPYASDAGVVLGDPTIRIDNKKNPDTGDLMYNSLGSGFTKDIGKEIFADSTKIKDVTPFDYDNDGDKDLLVLYDSGEIRLLENENHGKDLIDRGVFLNFTNGVISSTSMDVNNDGWSDLVVATADSCKVGEVCIDAYLNNKTNFNRVNLPLKGFTAKNKVFMLRAADMNKDGFDDLVASDDSGSIRIFYGKDGAVALDGTLVGNLGVTLNENDNLKAEVKINYPGMIGNQPGKDDDKYFENLNIDGVSHEFKSLATDAILGISSTKKVKNLTSKNVQLGDEIEYKVTLINTSNANLKNLNLADIVPSSLEVNIDSIKCSDCDVSDANNSYKVLESGQSLRPYLITGIDLPAAQKNKYGATVPGIRTVVYTGKVKTLPKVKFVIGKDLNSAYPVKDGLPDIMAAPEQNPTSRVVHYYSISTEAGANENSPAKVIYGKYVTPDPKAGANSDYKPLTDPKTGNSVGMDLSTLDQKDENGVPVAIQHYLDYGTFPGQDGGGGGGVGDSISELPGIGKAYDAIGNALDEAANKLENAIASLTCSGGCIPTPINMSFLTPGVFNILGIPGSPDPGFPVFAWGVPSIIPVWPPSPYQGSAGGRIYVSPTLTGKVAISTCLGLYLVGFGTPVPGNCWTVVPPIDLTGGLCDAIAGAIDKAISSAQTAINDGLGSIGISSDGSAMADASTSDGQTNTGGFNGSTSLGNYQVKASAGVNMRIPGFPSVITNWLDNQQSEIINKLTDLPDIYILLPNVYTLIDENIIQPIKDAASKEPAPDGNKPAAQPMNPQGLRGVLNTLNKIPLISIVPQEVIIKVPSLSPAEIDRLINDAKQWVKDEKAEWYRVKNMWTCFKKPMTKDASGKDVPGYYDEAGNIVPGDAPQNTLCNIIGADFQKTIDSVEKNIEVLESYKQLPRKLLAWRNMLTKYIVQVICYIDAILSFFIGNISKWINQANGWVDAAAKVVEVIMTWKLLISLVIDYQTDCDKCTSARFTLLELILKLFMFIPSPPIIPFPKLPDIYIDLSNVEMGIKILWPDIRFVPERLILPTLPRFYLPDLPKVRIQFPSIPVLPELLMNLPELPDLPPLSLPVLPNLPPPPKIPALPGAVKATISILKKIFKILCLIKKGFIPTSEMVLKSTVESMTERGLSPLLKLDLGLSLQWPEISYNFVTRIVLTTFLKLNFNFSAIYNLVNLVAEKMNAVTTNLVNYANQGVQALDNATQNAANAVNDTLQQGANAAQNTINAGTDYANQKMQEGTTKAQNSLNESVDKTNKSLGAPVLKPKGAYVPATQAEGIFSNISADLSNDNNLAKEFAMFSPLLAEYIAGFRSVSKDLNDQAKTYQQIIDKDFQDIHLVAGQKLINPNSAEANKTIEELDQFEIGNQMASLGNEGFAETRKLAGLRKNLMAYVKEFDHNNKSRLNVDNLEEFGKVLAMEPTLGDILAKSGYQNGTMLAQNSSKMYAKVPTVNDAIKNSGIDPKSMNQPVAKGVFIYNEKLKVNEKLINYEDELSSATTMNFQDMDGDGDQDLILSFGGNIYLKNNYKNNLKKGVFFGNKALITELNDFVPAARAVTGFKANFNGNKSVDLKWNASVGANGDPNSVTGYELIYGKTLKTTSESLSADGLSKKVYINSADQLNLSITNSLLQPGDNNFDFPVSKLYQLVAVDVQGEVKFNGPEQKVYGVSGDRIEVEAGDEIFSTQNTSLKVYLDSEEKNQKKMMENELIILPLTLSGKLEIQVENGSITIIKPTKQVADQLLQTGYKVDLDVVYSSINKGSAQIILPKGAYTRVDAGQDLEIKVLEDPNQPKTSLSLPNGFFYAAIRSFDDSGFRSDKSTTQLMAPNICSDRQQPLPVAGPSEKKVAIYKTLEIDASKSFDPLGKVSEYFLDTDLDFDSNGDGDKTNDRNLGHHLEDGSPQSKLNDPVFHVGPYKDLNDRKVMLNVVDESGNVGQQEISIQVYVPLISLDQSSANLKVKTTGEGGIVSGILDEKLSDMPVSLLRERDGIITPIKTGLVGPNDKYLTDDHGQFKVDDLKLKDSVVIKNSAGEIVAEIDPKTGRVILKNPLYSLTALPAIEPLLPTRIVVKDPNNKVIATVFVVSDANTDVQIDPADFPYNAGTVAVFNGVHIQNLISDQTAPNLLMRNIPGNSKKNPGAAEIIDQSTEERLALLDTGGNFYINDPRVDLELEPAENLNDPMIFSVNWQKDDQTFVTIGRFHIAYDSNKNIKILGPEKFKMYSEDPQRVYKNKALQRNRLGTNAKLSGINSSILQMSGSPFIDVDTKNPYFKSIMNLLARGILAGIPAGNSLRFGFMDALQRAEFAKMMLDVFCIVPRPEAYEEPSVFYDIPFIRNQAQVWYYAPVKEAYFQGFITGYLALIDKETGRTPFQPESTISKAEAVKVILEALEKKGVISLQNIPKTEPYYQIYMQIAQNLTPYLVKGQTLKGNYIITAEEAVNPEEAIKRGDFVKLVDRVLSMYDCTLLDTDGDGMPDYWENLHNLKYLDASDNNEDPDGDDLTNLEEFKNGTDPNNADTDGGGIKDGVEVKVIFTDPLESGDEKAFLDNQKAGGITGEGQAQLISDPRKDLEPGVYVVSEACSSCPCPSAIDHTADLLPGDKLLGVISSDDNQQIFSESNVVVIEAVEEQQ